MQLSIQKIALENLSRKELKVYKTLDATNYGERLAVKIANKLAKNPNTGLCHFHRDYCGLGLFIDKDDYTLNVVEDGWKSYAEDLIITFESKIEFTAWLSKENDQSMSLFGKKFNNQTITKTRLKWYLEENYSPIWNDYCAYLRKQK